MTYAQYLPLTLRQVFYALVGQDVLDKSEAAYERLGEIVNRARRARLLDFADIRDDGVTERAYPYYDSTEGFWDDVEEQIHGYRRDRQAGQPAFIELWCEAAGMVPQIFRVAAHFGIPVFSSGGFNSTTANWELAQRALGRSVPTVIMHLGDFDPSGESIFQRIVDDAAAFVLADRANPSIHVAGVRLALTEKQVKRYDLPTAPPKKSDSRAANWRGKGTGTCPARGAAAGPARLHHPREDRRADGPADARGRAPAGSRRQASTSRPAWLRVGMDDRRDLEQRPLSLVTANTVAERLGVTPAWVLAEARARRLPCFRFGRQVRFSWGDVQAYLDACFVAHVEATGTGDRRVTGPKAGVPGIDLQVVSSRGPAVALPGKLFPQGKGARTS